MYINNHEPIHSKILIFFFEKSHKKQESLLHRKLKTTVAFMEADAKARFSKIVDIAEDREFSPSLAKRKALIELQVCGSIMNLLLMADSDIPALERFITITSS